MESRVNGVWNWNLVTPVTGFFGVVTSQTPEANEALVEARSEGGCGVSCCTRRAFGVGELHVHAQSKATT
jgi:hypothetical protein